MDSRKNNPLCRVCFVTIHHSLPEFFLFVTHSFIVPPSHHSLVLFSHHTSYITHTHSFLSPDTLRAVLWGEKKRERDMKLPNIATITVAGTGLLVSPRDAKTHDDSTERHEGTLGFEPAVECGEYPAAYFRPPVNFTEDLLWKYVCGDW